jgi:hypothetical protein
MGNIRLVIAKQAMMECDGIEVVLGVRQEILDND